MKQISGNKLLVKALKEEGVDVCSAILVPAPSISAMNYINRAALTSSCHVTSRPLYMKQMPMPELPERLAYVSLPAVPELPTLLQVLQLPTMTAFRLYALPDRLPVTSSETMRSRRLILSGSPEASQNTVLPSATVRISVASSKKLFISQEPAVRDLFLSTFLRTSWQNLEAQNILRV